MAGNFTLENIGIQIKKRASTAGEFLPVVSAWMTKIEKILTSGGTSPNDFTLHDADHSFRVSERMWELIPLGIRKNISDYELALLLLSAYCHDIGMTPERARVQAHYQHLFDPKNTALSQAEQSDLQKFLDEYQSQPISLPLCVDKPTNDDLNLADELITFYVRSRHNNWSADWTSPTFGRRLFWICRLEGNISSALPESPLRL